MKVKLLQTKHPKHNADLWSDYEALYRGGHVFRDRLSRFLAQNPQEPLERYRLRCKEAVYRSYIGTVCDFFAALLFTSPILYTPTTAGEKPAEPPEWVAPLEKDCDGRGTDLVGFLHGRLIDAMVKGVGYLRLDFPDGYGSGTSRAEADKLGATDVRIAAVQREQILDWETDRRGRLLWAVVYETERPRAAPADERKHTRHCWWVLTRDTADLYEVDVENGAELSLEQELEPVRQVVHRLGTVPLVALDAQRGLWVADRLESPQLEHFRLTSSNNWSMRQTCYAMPIFKLADPDNRPTKMGAGYYIELGPDDDADWMAPPTAHLAVVRDEVKAQKDEIFRLVTQMSLGVDNNAAAIGRSAESKAADADAIQVVLRGYGARVRDALQNVLGLLSRARGDELEWAVEGLDKFETIDGETLVTLLEKALKFQVPSETFEIESKYRVGMAILPGLDRATKDKIRKEIEDGVPQQRAEAEAAKKAAEEAQNELLRNGGPKPPPFAPKPGAKDMRGARA